MWRAAAQREGQVNRALLRTAHCSALLTQSTGQIYNQAGLAWSYTVLDKLRPHATVRLRPVASRQLLVDVALEGTRPVRSAESTRARSATAAYLATCGAPDKLLLGWQVAGT